jgi:hypothetical protein
MLNGASCKLHKPPLCVVLTLASSKRQGAPFMSRIGLAKRSWSTTRLKASRSRSEALHQLVRSCELALPSQLSSCGGVHEALGKCLASLADDDRV